MVETISEGAGQVPGRFAGTVKFFNVMKGFGFIVRDDGERDCFVHAKSLPEGVIALEPGQRVGFSVTRVEKGDRAINVTVAAEPEAGLRAFEGKRSFSNR